MAVKDALLALLADGPRYGYQLKSAFDAATGQSWPLNIGQVYTTLQRLERDELIVESGDPGDDGRRSYELTALGREAVAGWFQTPADPPGADRDELSMKVLLAVATNTVSPMVLVNEERTAAMGHLQALTAQKAQAGSADLATRLHLDRTVLLADAQVRWLNLVEQRLEQFETDHPTSFPTADISTAHSSSADISTAHSSSADIPTADISTADSSSADISTADSSSADISTADSSSADIPSTDGRSTDTATADTPTAAASKESRS